MSNELRVRPAHLNELANGQGLAAATLAAAVATVHGAGASVASTHGSIASATASAVSTLEKVRGAAGDQLAARSREMQDDLERAAVGYRHTDEASADGLGGTVH